MTVERDVTAPPQNPAFLKSEKTAERTICITYDKGKTTAGQVLALVQQQGFVIEDVTTREADLEDVFVQLTSGERDEA
jgi:ABC-2 type transport system ATP-binding protein